MLIFSGFFRSFSVTFDVIGKFWMEPICHRLLFTSFMDFSFQWCHFICILLSTAIIPPSSIQISVCFPRPIKMMIVQDPVPVFFRVRSYAIVPTHLPWCLCDERESPRTSSDATKLQYRLCSAWRVSINAWPTSFETPFAWFLHLLYLVNTFSATRNAASSTPREPLRQPAPVCYGEWLASARILLSSRKALIYLFNL